MKLVDLVLIIVVKNQLKSQKNRNFFLIFQFKISYLNQNKFIRLYY